MGIWKEKVYPKIQKIFGKDGTKKAAAAEACKSFDESKEVISKEFEEKQEELKPKVIEIYEASSKEVKILIKEPKEQGLKKHSTKVQKFLDELAKIDFPGSKTVSESSSKYGLGLVSGPVTFVFEKVSTFIVVEEVVTTREAEEVTPPPTEEPPAAAAAEAAAAEEIVAEEKAVEEAIVEELVAEEVAKEEEKKEEPPKA
ncbi:hypothetical protein V2J09_021334 [Rumex salicifolius]